jgi:TonB family protein
MRLLFKLGVALLTLAFGVLITPAHVRKAEEDEPACLRADAPRPKHVVSFGVLNWEAVELPKPVYPGAAKAARISGEVRVEATAGEDGRVVRARVRTGHDVLQAAVKKVVCQARFKPFKLSGGPVAVNGIIVYKFILER